MLDTSAMTVEEAAGRILDLLRDEGYIGALEEPVQGRAPASGAKAGARHLRRSA